MSKIQLQKHIENDELDLSLQNLTDVPVKEIAKFSKLRSIDLSCNALESIPLDIGVLVQITKLDLSKNKITTLPEEIGQMVNLEYLDLRANQLVNLPLGMCNLKKLKWLDLKGNPLSQNLKNAAGDCLDSLKCSKCAENVLACLEVMKMKKQKNDEKKKLKENEIQKQKEKQEKELRDRKKIERTQERINKRNLEQEKLAQSEHDLLESAHNSNNGTIKSSKEAKALSEKNKTDGVSRLLSRLFLGALLGLLLITVAMIVLVACDLPIVDSNEHTRQWCQAINSRLPPSLVTVRDSASRYLLKYALNV